jgi:hypothetical protein
VAHVGSWCLVHEGCIVAVGFGKADFIRNVGVDSLVGSGLSGEGRIVLLHHFLLHADVALLLVSLLVPDHFEIFNLGLGSRWKSLLHALFGGLERTIKLFAFVLKLDDVGLAHGEFRDCGFHLASEITKARLELVDLFRNFKGRLPALSGISFQLFD